MLIDTPVQFTVGHCSALVYTSTRNEKNVSRKHAEYITAMVCCVQFYFAILSAFSGQIVFERWCIGLYNVVCMTHVHAC